MVGARGLSRPDDTGGVGHGEYASLKDVASRAGVSFQTVSKVLNGGGSVAPATLERIRRAAEEVGYIPNVLARGLVMRGTKTLGIVAADPSDHVLGRFVVAAEIEARRQGWATVVANVDAFTSDVGRHVEVLSERRVDGILMAAPQAETDPDLGERLRGLLPVVSLYTILGLRAPLVGSDHVQTGMLAVRHLILHGHRTVGVVAGTLGRHVTAARMTGYARAFSESNIELNDSDLVEEGDWTTAGGYLATMRLLDRAPEVTALFVHNDYMAMGAIRALYERNRDVPGDVAVVGCDDAPVAAYTVPSLTTVRVPFEDTGRVAMGLLLRMVGGGPAPITSTLLPVELVARASCGCAVARGTAPPAAPGAARRTEAM
ncbi:MAG: LacI family DNA-binding transcriptional regulator [Solirubrobacterales bacterium]|nr:LacI family DNA-binding transcriptional regulator [Solirubrobacterales bacterium]